MTLTLGNSLSLLLRGDEMKYTVGQLAKISGISSRTLRHYDEIGLLKPERINPNGYRIYGQVQVDALQQILFYRELDISLEEIKKILNSPEFVLEKALENHLIHLKQEKKRTEMLIENVNKTISSLKGETIMSDKEKFEGFKRDLIDENEKKYGKEIRKKYGVATINDSNAKLMGMTEEQWLKQEDLADEINKRLRLAIETGDPAGKVSQEVCDLHRQWICMFWKDGMYSKEAHKALGEMYVSDERFKAFYDRINEGAAEFLNKALKIYCAR